METQNNNKYGNTLAGAGSGAAAGLAIGSVVPGIGNVVGAVAGGLIGGVAGFFSGQTTVEKEVKSLRVGPGNINAGYSNQEVGKDYAFDSTIKGGEQTELAKAAMMTNQGLQLAGSVASLATKMPSSTMSSSSMMQGIKMDPLQNNAPIVAPIGASNPIPVAAEIPQLNTTDTQLNRYSSLYKSPKI